MHMFTHPLTYTILMNHWTPFHHSVFLGVQLPLVIESLVNQNSITFGLVAFFFAICLFSECKQNQSLPFEVTNGQK